MDANADAAPPVRTYILDTQAIIGLNGDQILEARKNGHDVAVSTLSLHELLRHLDEEKDSAPLFHRYSMLLGKARRVRILDDPWLAHVSAIKDKTPAQRTSLGDHVVMERLLEALASTSSLEEFYGRTVVGPQGEEREVAGCAHRARQVLADAKLKYDQRIRHVRDAMQGEVGRSKLRDYSSADFVDDIVRMVRNVSDEYRSPVGPDDGLLARVFSSTCVHFAYLFHRTRRAMLNVGAEQPIHVDPNDLIDGALCLYLDLAQPVTLVTGDKGIREAVDESLAHIDAVSRTITTGEARPVLARVASRVEFEAEVGVTGS